MSRGDEDLDVVQHAETGVLNYRHAGGGGVDNSSFWMWAWRVESVGGGALFD
jgi:hypothetical protein